MSETEGYTELNIKPQDKIIEPISQPIGDGISSPEATEELEQEAIWCIACLQLYKKHNKAIGEYVYDEIHLPLCHDHYEAYSSYGKEELINFVTTLGYIE